MFLSAAEVAVKVILYEAKVVAVICCGHPNLPLFMGVYDFAGGLPYLITRFYSVDGKHFTLHKLLNLITPPRQIV